MAAGRRNNLIFCAANIISTLNIDIDKEFRVDFKETFDSFGATSIFTIDHKEQPRYCFISENFENDDVPNFIASFDVFSTDNGVFTPLVNIQHPKFKALMSLVNRYIKVFMIIYGYQDHCKVPTINLHIAVKYGISTSGKLTLTDLSLISLIIIRSLDEETKINIEENIENIVDNYLKKIGFTNIDEHTNFEELLILVNMQKTVDDMVLI